MDVFEITSFIIVGAVVGSFLNVVILRYNTGMGFTMGSQGGRRVYGALPV